MNKTKEIILEEFNKRKLMTMGGSSFECSDYEGICDDTIEFIKQSLEDYADWKIKECLPEKESEPLGNDIFFEGKMIGWNLCISKILSNCELKIYKDKK